MGHREYNYHKLQGLKQSVLFRRLNVLSSAINIIDADHYLMDASEINHTSIKNTNENLIYYMLTIEGRDYYANLFPSFDKKDKLRSVSLEYPARNPDFSIHSLYSGNMENLPNALDRYRIGKIILGNSFMSNYLSFTNRSTENPM